MKLVPEWRSLWRSHSVRFQAAAAAFFIALGSMTDVAIEVWRGLPDDIRGVFPPWFIYGFGVALIVGGILSKFYVQRKLTEARDASVGQEGQPGVQGEGDKPL
ncbi:hypothetical protein [Achromobacter aegrifaciens]|uniref:DUF7940 domain-containing protein n=1 Tax=Achromobacter aegrifaciens TaxID=1287736 RepID=UPI00320A7198